MSQDVIKLEFPKSVRTRPGMYVGATDDASTLLREVADNSIDEGYACKYNVDIHINKKENHYFVGDTGRGIPLKKSKHDSSLTMARLAMSSISAGSKFNKTGIAVGMNGTGTSCVNALSDRFFIMTRYNKHDYKTMPSQFSDSKKKANDIWYCCYFEKGILVEEEVLPFSHWENLLGFPFPDGFTKDLSTITIFKPDLSIYKSASASFPKSIQYYSLIQDYFKKGGNIFFNGSEYTGSVTRFNMNFDRTILTEEEDAEKNEEITFLVSIKVTKEMKTTIKGSVNGVKCDLGLHITQINKSFTEAFEGIYGDTYGTAMLGISAISVILANEVDFDSQTKDKLVEVPDFKMKRKALPELVSEFTKLIKKNKDVMDAHNRRLMEYLKSMDKLEKIDIIKSTISIAKDSKHDAYLPIKLRDATEERRDRCELFIVEGDSAGGIFIPARNQDIHAILPLRGKPKNCVELEIEETLENQEMYDLINCIGCGVDDYNDVSKIRYGKVIIAGDADPDGSQISALVLANIAAHMRFLIDEGLVYIAEAPLYQQGKEYFWKFEDLDPKKESKRFKGLGEMNPPDIKKTMLDPETRRLIQITSDDLEEAISFVAKSGTKLRTQHFESIGIINKTRLTKEEVYAENG